MWITKLFVALTKGLHPFKSNTNAHSKVSCKVKEDTWFCFESGEK